MENLEHGWIVEDYEEEEKVVRYCAWCGEPIYEGDYEYDIGSDYVCHECIINARRTAQ
jgi:formylmethanofuran dehydrogenase subunit E